MNEFKKSYEITGDDILKTHRISTTISDKHWKLLKTYAEKFETQQKTLELALESLENSSKQGPELTLEEKYWMRLKWAKSAVIIEKNAFKLLIETTDIGLLNELFIRDKTIEYTIELYFQKPLEVCSLEEVIDGLVINLKITNWFDTVYKEERDYYTLRMTHSMGIKFSKLIFVAVESALKTYGVKAEGIISEKTIFINIHKN
ncbi:MAG: hypothetical protein AB3K77_02145 [Methanosarcinaceae archaeon]